MAYDNKAFGIAVCNALGIPANTVRSITIRLDARDVTVIDVTLIPKAIGLELHDALALLREDGMTVNVNWTRPIYDVTNMTSKAVEVGE
jgi:hypothetical protein